MMKTSRVFPLDVFMNHGLHLAITSLFPMMDVKQTSSRQRRMSIRVFLTGRKEIFMSTEANKALVGRSVRHAFPQWLPENAIYC